MVVPSPLWVENTRGAVCFTGQGANSMGKSECEIQLPFPRTADQEVTAVNPDLEVKEQVTFTIKAALHHDNGMIPPKGIHLVCGDKAYPYLPKGWGGEVVI